MERIFVQVVDRIRFAQTSKTKHWVIGPKRLPFLAMGLFVAALLIVDGRPLRGQEVIPFPTQLVIPQETAQAQVSPSLREQLDAGAGDVAILILLKEQPDIAALEAAAIRATSSVSPSGSYSGVQPTTRGAFFYHELTTAALQSQTALRAWLEAEGIPYRAHYIINMISVSGGVALVDALRQRPDVARLDANPQVDVMHREGVDDGSTLTTAMSRAFGAWARIAQLSETPTALDAPNVPYGISATRAPEVWALGYTGQGIIVASQDTGVQWDHPSLRLRYRGTLSETVDHTYNWLNAIPDNGNPDPCGGIDFPCDDNGHGTHTVGTMVGASDVFTYGVAPDAQWMGCRNMRLGIGTPESYTTCFEFFLAPYPPDGDPFVDGRPELAPHIINNSWGCPNSEGCNKDSLRQAVEIMRAAGIMVVASAGNVGYTGCSSVIDPIAIYDATFTVGAHDSNGNLAAFSSRGPVTADGSGRLKPDLTAPGVSVFSTYRFSSTTSLSGTSMASPHVAGAVALLWSAVPWLVGNPDLTEQVLLKSATPVYSNLCGDDSLEEVSPNPAFGYGRLDVAAAVEMAMQPRDVTVSVVNEVNAPVEGANVIWTDARTGYAVTVTTSISGSARISPTLAGTYLLQVQGDAGFVEIDDIVLELGDMSNRPQRMHFNVLYDEAIVPYPARHFLPGVFQRVITE